MNEESEDIYDFSGCSLDDLSLMRTGLLMATGGTTTNSTTSSASSNSNGYDRKGKSNFNDYDPLAEAKLAAAYFTVPDNEEWYPPTPPPYDVTDRIIEANRDLYSDPASLIRVPGRLKWRPDARLVEIKWLFSDSADDNSFMSDDTTASSTGEEIILIHDFAQLRLADYTREQDKQDFILNGQYATVETSSLDDSRTEESESAVSTRTTNGHDLPDHDPIRHVNGAKSDDKTNGKAGGDQSSGTHAKTNQSDKVTEIIVKDAKKNKGDLTLKNFSSTGSSSSTSSISPSPPPPTNPIEKRVVRRASSADRSATSSSRKSENGIRNGTGRPSSCSSSGSTTSTGSSEQAGLTSSNRSPRRNSDAKKERDISSSRITRRKKDYNVVNRDRDGSSSRKRDKVPRSLSMDKMNNNNTKTVIVPISANVSNNNNVISMQRKPVNGRPPIKPRTNYSNNSTDHSSINGKISRMSNSCSLPDLKRLSSSDASQTPSPPVIQDHNGIKIKKQLVPNGHLSGRPPFGVGSGGRPSSLLQRKTSRNSLSSNSSLSSHSTEDSQELSRKKEAADKAFEAWKARKREEKRLSQRKTYLQTQFSKSN